MAIRLFIRVKNIFCPKELPILTGIFQTKKISNGTFIENFLEKEKCDELIKICEEKNDKSIYNFSNQFRIKFIDIIIQEMIQKIYNEKIKLILNSDFYINDSFSYVRYNNDGLIISHYDKYLNNNARFSILIYLNDEYDDGETYIYNENQTKIIFLFTCVKICIFALIFFGVPGK